MDRNSSPVASTNTKVETRDERGSGCNWGGGRERGKYGAKDKYRIVERGRKKERRDEDREKEKKGNWKEK